MTKTYTHAQDNGKNGKNFEVAVRMAITPRTTVRYCKNATKVDHFIKLNGKRANIEVKTGAGTLDYNHNGELDTAIPATDHINGLLADTDFVVYAPTWEGDDVLENAWVFTRQAFLDMLNGYKGMVRYTKKTNGTCINIQTFTNSKKRLNYIWNTTLDQPNLGEWLSEVRG